MFFILIDVDRDACDAYKQHMLENKSPHMNQSNTSNTSNSKTALSSISNASNQSNPISRKPFVRSTPKQNPAPKKTLSKKAIEFVSRPSNDFEDHDENFNNNQTTCDDTSDCRSPSRTVSNEKPIYRATIGDTLNASISITDHDENDIYLDKINQLSAELEQQKQLGKIRENEIKRLVATTIGNTEFYGSICIEGFSYRNSN